MAREQLGTAPSIAAHTATKSYSDSGTQTMTNKTLTSPTINDIRTDNIYDVNGNFIGTVTNGRIALYGNAIGNDNKIDVSHYRHAARLHTSATDTGWHAAWLHRSASTGSLIGFYYGANTTLVGNITTNGSSTTYGTTSDYRLKEDVVDLASGIETISALRPVSYNWKVTGLYGEGFLAHELQEVIPEAVDGEKDAELDGWIVPQTVDLSKVVPHLVSAVQELTTRLEAAEARIAQLEGNASG